jgi:hypothetical protein
MGYARRSGGPNVAGRWILEGPCGLGRPQSTWLHGARRTNDVILIYSTLVLIFILNSTL